MKTTVGVIGWKGMVGGTVFKYYQERKDYEVFGWSRSSETHPLETLLEKSDWIFVCVPTPYDWRREEYKLTSLEDTLRKIPAGKRVIIKSTIPPGTTSRLQEKYKDVFLFFNPEFLSEATAYSDFINPDRQIIGYTDVSFPYATEALHLLPNSPYDVMMPATDAEIVKYVNNFHGALMVIFSNLIYDICKSTDANFETVKKASQASKWVGSPMGRMYWNVEHGGYRGYGGKCFPKDINTLLEWCAQHEIPAEILQATRDANIRILDAQDMTEEDAERHTTRS